MDVSELVTQLNEQLPEDWRGKVEVYGAIEKCDDNGTKRLSLVESRCP